MDTLSQVALNRSGLAPDWSSLFNGARGISVKQTNANNNDKSVADTVGMMGVHARSASASPQVRQALQEAGCLQSGLTEDQVIQQVFSYIKGKVRFVQDEDQLANIFEQPRGKELLITPPVLLSMNQPQGDCDDFSMLCCSMLMAKGIQCDFVTVAADGNNPTEFSHVYCMARTRGGRNIPLDISHGREVGWETSKSYRKMVWPVFASGARGGARGMGRNGMGGLGTMRNGLGDDISDLIDQLSGNASYSSSVPTQATISVPAATSPSSINWNNLLPGLFGSVEKIAIQTTQQPGIQTTGPGGVSSSVVLPAGATSIPSLSSFTSSLTSGGSSGLFLLLGIGLVALLVLKKD